jgi:WD40 repeat protein
LKCRYQAFISYSQAADGKLARALQVGLERFAKPWYRLRALRVFRDKTGLAVTPELWPSIQKSLEGSEYFILLASPAAAQSKWVCQEIEFWLQARPREHFLIVITDGVIAWDPHLRDFDWAKTDALPRLLQGQFKGEPNYLDLRWVRADTDLSVRRPRFLDAIASLSSTIRNVPLDDLIGEDVGHYRTTRRLLRIAVVSLLALTVAASYAAYLANQARNLAQRLESESQAGEAAKKRAQEEEILRIEAERLASLERARKVDMSRKVSAVATEVLSKDRTLSTLLAMEAVQLSPTAEAEAALRHSLMKRAPPSVLRLPGNSSRRIASTIFNSDGRRLLAVVEDGSVSIWTLSSPNEPVSLRPESIARYPEFDGTTAFFSPDGSSVLTVASPTGGVVGTPKIGALPAARIWNASTGQLRRELLHPDIRHAAFSRDGSRVITVGSYDDSIRIWDVGKPTDPVTVVDHEGEVLWVAFAATGQLFLTAGWDDTVRIRNTVDGKTMAVLRLPSNNFFVAADFSPDGRWVLTSKGNEPLRVWDWRTSPGNSTELRGTEEVYSAEFDPDSKWLLTAGSDRSARLWEIQRGRILYELTHEERVTRAVFSPNGRWILTASLDDTAVLWDASTGKRLFDFGSDGRRLTSAAFSPDGLRIASGTTDGEILLFDCGFCGSLGHLIDIAKSQATRSLTADEREKHLGTAVAR